MKKIAIIGAGPAGITAAYQLSKSIKNIHVFESSNSVGGLSKSIILWGQTVDIGPHRFFSKDKRINDLWLEIVKNDYEMVNRLTRIYYKKKFYDYPLKPFNALYNLGFFEAIRCFFSYLAARLNPIKVVVSFEDWVKNRFGKRLFQFFFKTYSEKLWGISCKDLDADFAAQRIKKLSLFEAIKNAVFSDKKNHHKTLVDQFAYPHEGTGMVYERMSNEIIKNDGKIFLETKVNRVIIKDNKATAIVLEDGTVHEYDHIISTMPITLLVSRIQDAPLNILENTKQLKYRNTIIVYLKVEAIDLFPDNWLYIHSDDLKMGRLTNFRNWVPQINGNENSTICALEYWCYEEEDFWSWDNNKLIDLATKELIFTGLIGDATISDGKVYRIPKCYPVYDKGYKERLNPIENYLKSIKNLYPIGRYGSFKYNNQDHSILMGYLAAENILSNTNHDLWNINTDYDEYQESSTISAVKK